MILPVIMNAAIRREALTLLAQKSAKVRFSNGATKLSHPLPHLPPKEKLKNWKIEKQKQLLASELYQRTKL